MRSREAAFSLLEALVTLAVVAGIAAVAFRLFHQNERLFRDQALILEMQQGARVVLSQVSDDARRAGQGIPLGIREIILPGSTATRLNLRASISAVESRIVSSIPFSLVTGVAATLYIESTSGFSAGRQAFLWSDLAWARVTVEFVSGSAQSVRLMPAELSHVPLEFIEPPSLSLDEAVSIYWDATAKAVRHTTASSTENPASPSWAPANELAANVASLTFIYVADDGNLLIPDSPAGRSAVSAIDVKVVVRSSAPLSNGTRPVYALTGRVTLRNARR